MTANSLKIFRKHFLRLVQTKDFVRASLTISPERGRVKKPLVDRSKSGFYQRFDHSSLYVYLKRHCLSHFLGTHPFVQTVTPLQTKIIYKGRESDFSSTRFRISSAKNKFFKTPLSGLPTFFCNLLFFMTQVSFVESIFHFLHYYHYYLFHYYLPPYFFHFHYIYCKPNINHTT